MNRLSTRATFGGVLGRLFLHRVSVAEATADFVRTSREALRSESFIDGRSDFTTGPAVRQSLESLVAAQDGVDLPERYIFHVSFCGSTLLARFLDIPGRALVLREPNCLADLANQRSAADVAGRPISGWSRALTAARRHLMQPWADGEPIIVKPSNWANNLLAELCAGPTLVRPLFLTLGRRSFLEAVFRGGPDRLAYTARAAVHLSSDDALAARRVASVLASGTDQMSKLATLAAVTHAIQVEQFGRVARDGGWGAEAILSLDDLMRDPLSAAAKAATTLGIETVPGELEASVARWSRIHAKQPREPFSAEQRQDQDRAIGLAYHDAIETALDWMEAEIGS